QQRLAGHPARRILSEDRVQHRIRDLIGNLVRMSLGHGLRSEQVPLTRHRHPPSRVVDIPCVADARTLGRLAWALARLKGIGLSLVVPRIYDARGTARGAIESSASHPPPAGTARGQLTMMAEPW